MITNIAEFIKETVLYFTNGFPNETVERRFAEKLSCVKPSSLERLFTTLTENFPATWTPDVKALKEAITAAGIITLADPEKTNKCPVCATTWPGTGLCPKCCYNHDTDGTIEEHRKWYNDWKAGKVQKYNVHDILSTLATQKNAREMSNNGKE